MFGGKAKVSRPRRICASCKQTAQAAGHLNASYAACLTRQSHIWSSAYEKELQGLLMAAIGSEGGGGAREYSCQRLCGIPAIRTNMETQPWEIS